MVPQATFDDDPVLQSISVDARDTLFVSDYNDGVFAIPKDSEQPMAVGPPGPTGSSVRSGGADGAANVYAAYGWESGVVAKLSPDGRTADLPFDALTGPEMVVNNRGAVVVVDYIDGETPRYQFYDPTSQTVTVLSIPGVQDGISLYLDDNDAIYGIDALAGRVVKIVQTDATPVTVTAIDLDDPHAITVDRDGAVYIAGLAGGEPAISVYTPGAVEAIHLPTEGLNKPADIAVDSIGSVYVIDELPAENGEIVQYRIVKMTR
ncbi:hypothetical protein O4157_16735 [Gordonia amicalis]|uniref:hypothetical protein n=1 Tax=Gordonia amicalis TaxID=89053 RepID=UPI0022B4F14F|nr:hypothetical protein [Gordonia amicalis]MCZ4653060.1 hypothetical protein [Gordonia amicalis]